MQQINIDNSYKEYSNQDVFALIKFIIRHDQYDLLEKLHLISACIGFISDVDLLNNTIKFIKYIGLTIQDEKIKPLIKNAQNSNLYIEEDLVHIESIMYSKVLHYELLKKSLPHDVEFEELQLQIDRRDVLSNYDEIYSKVRKASIKNIISNSEDPLGDIKCLINTMNEIDYKNDTDTFDRDIKYLETLKNNLPNDMKYPPEYLNFFKGSLAFEKFDKWMNKSQDNPQNKISFIFHRLKKDKELRNQNQIDFILWAYNSGYIDQDTYEKLEGNGQFITAKNVLSQTRNDLYNAIK